MREVHVRRVTSEGREIRNRKTEGVRERNERKPRELETREFIVKGRSC